MECHPSMVTRFGIRAIGAPRRRYGSLGDSCILRTNIGCEGMTEEALLLRDAVRVRQVERRGVSHRSGHDAFNGPRERWMSILRIVSRVHSLGYSKVEFNITEHRWPWIEIGVARSGLQGQYQRRNSGSGVKAETD